jgi:hypothetical protein
MSLNKLLNEATGQALGLRIGCQNLLTETLQCNSQIDMGNGTDLNSHNLNVENDLEVKGDATLGGVNYNTPDIGQANFSLHTDGIGNAFWAPDDTGSGDITYNGAPPTVSGQLVKFSSTDGKTALQSLISDDGVSLNLNGQEISNVGLVDGVDIQSFKDDYDANIDQEVKSTSSPQFNNLNVNTYLNVDAINEKTLDNGIVVDGVILKDGLVDGVDVSQLESDFQLLDDDYTANIDQAVKTTSTPTFAGLGLESNLTIKKSTNTPSAPAVDCFKSRGTIASPTAVLVGDILSSLSTYSHDGTSYADVAFIRTQATENHTPGAKGTKMEFYTTNGINPVVALTLEQDGRATLGIGDDRYLLPNSSAGVVAGSTLAFNVSTKDLEFKNSYNYSVQFGGNVNGTGNYAVPQADPNFATNGTLNSTKEIIVPVDSYLEKLTYSTSAGDATSNLQIVVDGSELLQFSITLGGAQGVFTLPPQPNRLLNEGARVAIKMSSGTSVGAANITCVFRN